MLAATIEGIGFWTQGLPSWDAAAAFVRGGALQDTGARPARNRTRWRSRWRPRWPPAPPPAAAPASLPSIFT
ncbi:hypothetical protein XPU_4143, partial [Xanthomonas arboricola pv. pruni str. MAFF 311562]